MQGPVSFNFSPLVGIGGLANPLAGWQYEFPDVDCLVEVILDATAVGLVAALFSGGDTIQQESPISSGGVAGVIPNVLNGTVVTGRARKGMRLSLNIRNPTAGAQTVNGKVTLIPGRGRR